MTQPIATFSIILLLLFTSNFRFSDSFSINCNYTVAGYPSNSGNYYSCIVYESSVVLFDGENDINVTSIYGVHASGKNDSSVEGFNLANQKLKYFPRRIETFFPNLKAINLARNAIVTISYDDLKPFTLTYLELGTNRLTSLNSNLLDSSPDLQYISFANNQINYVDENIKISSNASAVWFRNNACINMDAFNASEIDKLKSNLLLKCAIDKPPTATAPSTVTSPPTSPPTSTPIEQCPISCSNLVTNLLENNLQLEARVLFLEKAINSLALQWMSS